MILFILVSPAKEQVRGKLAVRRCCAVAVKLGDALFGKDILFDEEVARGWGGRGSRELLQRLSEGHDEPMILFRCTPPPYLHSPPLRSY